jgi:hypothetical protein
MLTEIKKIQIDNDFRLKIHGLIENILISNHGSGQKARIKKMHNRLNFACPYCGDSSDDILKKRGNLFWDSLHYHCYNHGCNIHKDLGNFINDFIPGGLDASDRIAISDYVKINTHKKQKDFLNENFEKIKNLAIPLSVFYTKTGTRPISIESEIYEYLKDRLLIKSLCNFSYCRGKLYVLNLTSDKKAVIGFQIRNMLKLNSSKYLTYNIEKMYQVCRMKTDETTASDEMQAMNNISTIFGIMNVDFLSKVTVFEGPLDSFFMPNSIALCTVDRKLAGLTDIPTVRYMFDNDKAGRESMLDLLKKGQQVFLWSKFIKEQGLSEYKLKDMNDLIKICFTKKLNSHKYINNYFSNNSLDAIYV